MLFLVNTFALATHSVHFKFQHVYTHISAFHDLVKGHGSLIDVSLRSSCNWKAIVKVPHD